MNATPTEPDEPLPPGPVTDARDWTYPEPPEPSHDGPPPCDEPAIYHVENLQ